MQFMNDKKVKLIINTYHQLLRVNLISKTFKIFYIRKSAYFFEDDTITVEYLTKN